jgi:acyl carrier protein
MSKDFSPPSKQPSLTEIENWLVAYMTKMMEVDEDEIDLSVPFDEYGLDSSMAVALIGDLEDWLGRDLDRTLIYDYPTLEKLAKKVSQS